VEAIKDCKWAVEVNKMETGGKKHYWWDALTRDNVGLNIRRFVCEPYFSTQKQTKANWEQFVRINKIKNWKYVK